MGSDVHVWRTMPGTMPETIRSDPIRFFASHPYIFFAPFVQVGWADSLSHRLYLFHKAMGMVASDGNKEGGAGERSRGGDSLPRAGEMMAGLTRQSQTLAVFIGLEDAPDASGKKMSGKPCSSGGGGDTLGTTGGVVYITVHAGAARLLLRLLLRQTSLPDRWIVASFGARELS